MYVCVWGVCFSFFINKQEQPLAVPKPGSALYCALHTHTHTHYREKPSERGKQRWICRKVEKPQGNSAGNHLRLGALLKRQHQHQQTHTLPHTLTHTHELMLQVVERERERESRQGQWQWQKPSSCIRLTYAFALFFYSYTAQSIPCKHGLSKEGGID